MGLAKYFEDIAERLIEDNIDGLRNEDFALLMREMYAELKPHSKIAARQIRASDSRLEQSKIIKDLIVNSLISRQTLISDLHKAKCINAELEAELRRVRIKLRKPEAIFRLERRELQQKIESLEASVNALRANAKRAKK